MVQTNPVNWYKEEESSSRMKKEELARQKNIIGWIRVGIFILGAVITWQSWKISIAAAFIGFAIAVAAFLWLLARSLNLSARISLLEQLINIHQEEQQIAEHHFTKRYNGHDLAPKSHAYAGDLDILGQASVFQYINRCTSEQGNRQLAKELLAPETTEEIMLRQKAAAEIALEPAWSTIFQATGISESVTLKTETRISEWMQQSSAFLPKRSWKLLAIIFPLISLGSLLFHIIGLLDASVFYLLVLVYVVIAFSITRKATPQYRILDKIVPELKTLSSSLLHIESSPFSAVKLRAIREKLIPANAPAASASIRLLEKILDRFDYRLNPLVFLFLNSFLLWDLRQILSLEKWKNDHGSDTSQWFQALAEMEMLNSLGRAAFNHPRWTFPTINAEHGRYHAISLGHPLIPEGKRVNNDFSTSGRPAISLITGSNMAGKSTFLRSMGVNQVLAMAGAPVCAHSLEVANMRIMSSMRIADNLEENASTFYAELSKLKSIIESVNAKEPVFLLLDEILRGTNSHDRHTGSRALLQQLVKQDACGMLATHDLALTELSNSFPDAISNYHFDVSVEGEELYFDYKLKPGICQSMNASILMKKIGIDLGG
ncbi:MutS family DNA mismatch repair protein [Flavihumibacter sp. ZG627]|uniref:MutS family DNA mismatch repair protein n=1 Tax=Flavihumibacter sp. ZG627 TaxID=1463156 RepID=UPI00057D49F8|nr:MutS family DNA mismatch repair protein [Flavihumibacter sp. ZG627]KIC91354.1 hypothetical protein HY58_03640 [Flavihumibacter sp. ZG627]